MCEFYVMQLFTPVIIVKMNQKIRSLNKIQNMFYKIFINY